MLQDSRVYDIAESLRWRDCATGFVYDASFMKAPGLYDGVLCCARQMCMYDQEYWSAIRSMCTHGSCKMMKGY